MTADAELQRVVAVAYWSLADLLSQSSAVDWDTPSLCEGWRVREVIAHLTMPARYDEEAFMAELAARDFDFDRLSNEVASRDAALPIKVLTANLRAEQLHEWTPPGGGFHGALNHVAIHGLDVTVPLGIEDWPDENTLRIVLDDLTSGGVHDHFGTAIGGRCLETTDIEWSYGSGAVLRGRAAEVALVLCGRRLPPGTLAGDPL